MKIADTFIAGTVFRAYREHSYGLYKTVVSRLLGQLLPESRVRAQAPAAMEVSAVLWNRWSLLVSMPSPLI